MNEFNLRTKLLIEYLSNNPNKEFIEIERYAEEIGAMYEELETALIQVGKEKLGGGAYDKLLSSLYKTVESTSTRTSIADYFKNILSPSYKIALLVACLSIFLLVSLLFKPIHSVLNKKATEIPVKKVENIVQKTEENFTPKIIYASENIIDAKKTFSYPPKRVSLQYTGSPKKEVIGFFPYWMLDVADQVQIEGLTAVSLFGLTANGTGDIVTTNENGEYEGWSMWNDSRTPKFISKLRRNGIKVYLTLKSFNNSDIEQLVLSDDAQKLFISNAIQLVNAKSLNGINIDFEYVGDAGKKVTDGFTRLIANLNSELKRQIPNSVITIDAYASSAAAPDFFDMQVLEKYVDAVIIMGYDINNPNTKPGPVAPLEGSSGLIGYVQSYLERVPPDKLILAVPYYGYDWQKDTEGGGQGISYAEIAEVSKKYNMSWDEASKTPYYTYTNDEKKERIVYFDNARSLGYKYDYVNNKNLKGIAIWALGYDGLNNELAQLIFEKFSK